MRRNADYLVGMRNVAVEDLTAEDLASMLGEHETLFVDTKAGLNGGGQGAVLLRVPTDAPGVLLGDLRRLQEQQEGRS
jgi:hypothetical protein